MARAAVKAASMSAPTRHEDDLYTWALEKIELLRARRFDENVAEELSDVAGHQYFKLQLPPRPADAHAGVDEQPEFRTPSWMYSIREQRRRYARIMAANPGLKSRREEALAEAYERARDWAANETDLTVAEFPDRCPYGWDDILERPFAADEVPPRR